MMNEGKKKYPFVFSPLKVKNIVYSNRLCSTTMSTVPTHIHLSSTNYGGIGIYDKSLGGVAMIGMMYHGTGGSTLYEANGADPFSKYQMDALRESLSVVKQRGALAGFAFGMGNTYQNTIYTPSGLPFARPYARDTKVMTEEVMELLLQQVLEKARKASKFGFDLLILDMSNDNIVGHFMAPGFNLREDEWGGSYENRFRLGKLLLRKIRETIGEHVVLELRISATLGVKETYPLEEMIRFLTEEKASYDIINVITGMDEYHDGNVKLCPPIFEKHILNEEVAKKIRAAIPDKILNLSGSIMNIHEAEKVLKEGICDLVLLGRSIVADPYMPRKVLEGREEDVVPCIRCNNCYHIATEHFNTCCSVNPRIYRENRVPIALEKTKHPKKVLVVGAGPAGLKAALTAYERGHQVMLVDQKDQIGGKLLVASKGYLKEDLRAYLTYLTHQVEKSDIQVVLHTIVDRHFLENRDFDSLIIAIGAEANTLNLAGVENEHVFQAISFIERGFEYAKDTITILGGGSVGCEIALELAKLNKKVTIIDRDQKLAKNGNELYRTSLLQQFAKNPNIRVLLNSECVKMEEHALLIKKDGEFMRVEHDEVVLSLGFHSNSEKVFDLFGVVANTVYVGDCKKVASITEATTEGYFIGASI